MLKKWRISYLDDFQCDWAWRVAPSWESKLLLFWKLLSVDWLGQNLFVCPWCCVLSVFGIFVSVYLTEVEILGQSPSSPLGICLVHWEDVIVMRYSKAACLFLSCPDSQNNHTETILIKSLLGLLAVASYWLTLISQFNPFLESNNIHNPDSLCIFHLYMAYLLYSITF